MSERKNVFTDERVTLDLERAEYNMLMLYMGMVLAVTDTSMKAGAIRLANAINEGNPHWVPMLWSK